MNGTIDFFSPSGEKLASTAGMTGVAPVKSGAIRIPVSAKDITGVQKDKNTLNILTKDNQKIVIKDFFGDAKKKLVFDDGKEIFEADYLPNEQFNGLQFKPLQSIDEVFEGTETAANDSDNYVWVVPLIAAVAIGGLGIAAVNHKGGSSKIKGRDTAEDKSDHAKDDANKAIDDMTYLSDEQKEAAHKAVNDATDVPGVEKAVADAAEKNLEGVKDDASKAIDEMEHLTDEQKDDAHQAVNDATDVPGVEKAVADAAEKNLEGAKDDASKAIDDMAHLTDEQKEAAHKAVNDATDVPDVEKAVADAAKDNLEGAKDAASKVIDDMAYLSDEQKEAAHKAVNDATDVPGVEKAVADAAKDNLEGAKDHASKAINEMEHLTDEQKDTAHKAVNDATDVPGVEKALDDAANLNDEKDSSFFDDILGGIWKVIIAIPKGLLEALKSVILKSGDYHFLLESGPAALTGVALIVWEAVVEIIHAPLSFLSNMAQWIIGFTTGILGGIWGPLGTIPHILNGILILVDGVVNGIKIIVESIGVGVITIPAIITGAIAWVITLVKGIGAVLSGDSTAMEDFIADLSQSLLQNPLIPLILGDLFVGIMVIPKLAVEAIGVIAEWILGIITGVLQFIPGLIPVASVISDFTLAIDGVIIAIHYGLSSVVNLITKLGMALIMGLPIAISSGASAVAIIEAFIKGVLGLNSDEDTSDNPVNNIIDWIIDFISSPISSIGDIISSIFSNIGKFIEDPFGVIGEIFQNVIDMILSPFKGIIDAVGSVIDFITSPFEAVGNIISGIMGIIGNIISNPFGAIGDMFHNVIDLILSPFKGIIDVISSVFNFITNPIDTIISLIGNPFALALKFITDPVGTITELFNKVIDTILSPFKGIIDFIGNVIYGITHPLETIFNIIKDTIAKIFGGPSDESTDAATESFNTITDTVESAAELATPAAEAIDNLLVRAEGAVDNFLEDPVEFVFGESNENGSSVKDLTEITSTLDELAGYADANVVSLTEMAEVQTSQEAITTAVSEELTDVQLASIMEESNASEIDLDSLIGTENGLIAAENNAQDEQHSVEDTEGYSVFEQIISQLQLNEDSYQFSAA